MQTKHFLIYLGLGAFVWLLISFNHALGAGQVPIPASWNWVVQIVLAPLGFVAAVLTALLPSLGQGLNPGTPMLPATPPTPIVSKPSVPVAPIPTAVGPIGLPNEAVPATMGATTVPSPNEPPPVNPVRVVN